MLRTLRRNTEGAVMVEFTIVAVLLFAVTFAVVEFGLALFWWVMTEKATERAARIASVRPAVAAGVPEAYERPNPAPANPPRFGTPCASVPGVCATVVTQRCHVVIATRSADDCANSALALTIFDEMRAISPLALRPGNAGQVTFTYSDSGLGFLGGPYIPMVSVEVEGATFQFIALGPLVRALGAAGFGDTIAMPTMRTTAVGEDLNNGENG
jgi:Flp pilus assembly protein TadG